MRNYLLLVTLEQIIDPEIYRLLSIPKTCSFHDLHRAIQTSFGWANCHLYKFTVTDPIDKSSTGPSPKPERHLQIKCDPDTGGGVARVPAAAAGSIKLPEVFENDKYKDKDVEYMYDFGDGWTHFIEFIGWASDDNDGKVVCCAGQGHGPAEDVGGAGGWVALAEAYEAKRPNREQKELRGWFENDCSNCDPQGLATAGGAWRWSRDEVNWELQQLQF